MRLVVDVLHESAFLRAVVTDIKLLRFEHLARDARVRRVIHESLIVDRSDAFLLFLLRKLRWNSIFFFVLFHLTGITISLGVFILLVLFLDSSSIRI